MNELMALFFSASLVANWRVSFCALVCLIYPEFSGSYDFIDNAFCCVVMSMCATLPDLKPSLRKLLISAGFIQLASLLSNTYYDFGFIIYNQIFDYFAYSVYLLFPFIVVIINLLIILNIWSDKFGSLIFNSDYRSTFRKLLH